MSLVKSFEKRIHYLALWLIPTLSFSKYSLTYIYLSKQSEIGELCLTRKIKYRLREVSFLDCRPSYRKEAIRPGTVKAKIMEGEFLSRNKVKIFELLVS